MSSMDFNLAKLNIPISVRRAFDEGKIADLYQEMYRVADESASVEAERRLTQRRAEYFDSILGAAQGAAQPSIIKTQSRVIDYKARRIDYHMKNMMHLLELYAQSRQKGSSPD